MNDTLGDRMKERFENRTRYFLPRRTYTIIRVDGKAFHTYTRGRGRPYDVTLMASMNEAAKALCEEIQGAKFAYVQSDEISILLTDFTKITTDAWFDGNIQKIVSVAASIATETFNTAEPNRKRARFDARVFTVPDRVEVENYFVWRQKDAVRNSISLAAQTYFSPNQLHGVSCDQMQDMLFKEKGINWSEYPNHFKNGRWVIKEPDLDDEINERTHWVAQAAPIFTQERDKLSALIPNHGYDSIKVESKC